MERKNKNMTVIEEGVWKEKERKKEKGERGTKKRENVHYLGKNSCEQLW